MLSRGFQSCLTVYVCCVRMVPLKCMYLLYYDIVWHFSYIHVRQERSNSMFQVSGFFTVGRKFVPVQVRAIGIRSSYISVLSWSFARVKYNWIHLFLWLILDWNKFVHSTSNVWSWMIWEFKARVFAAGPLIPNQKPWYKVSSNPGLVTAIFQYVLHWLSSA